MSIADYKNPTLTIEAEDHCCRQMEYLRGLLDQLVHEPSLMLCYVATDIPAHAPICSPIGITLTPTPAGVQYCIAEYVLGRRGGGSYYHSTAVVEMMEDIGRRLRYYHRTTPLTAKCKAADHRRNQFMMVRNPNPSSCDNLDLCVEVCPPDVNPVDFLINK